MKGPAERGKKLSHVEPRWYEQFQRVVCLLPAHASTLRNIY